MASVERYGTPGAPTQRADTRQESDRRGPALPRFNLALWLGLLIVLVIGAIAILGPELAPRDPLEETLTVRLESGDWVQPPFPPLTVPGYPLGSDELGRDLLSRLLWAVQPTMIIVLLGATLRLVVGTLVGAVAGWSTRWPGRLLDSLIAASLAIPVLIVALAVIAALGVRWGPLAFVLGLSLTGWAESARIIRDQSRAIRGESYIEAATAAGASGGRIIRDHIIRQLRPLLWMLFAFEISNTLVLTAALGFLGYFAGGEIWLAISDTVAQRFTGMPELGQMLSGSIGTLFQGPWRPFAAGTMIFLIVLGFNLLGEGLRRRATLELATTSPLDRALTRLRHWMTDTMVDPLYGRFGPRRVQGAFASVVLLVGFGGVALWRAGIEPVAPGLPVPGGHLWATERHDPFGTMQTAAAGPDEPEIVWRVETGDTLSGGPAVAADGTIYVAGTSRRLYAYDPEGHLEWSLELRGEPVGTPALDVRGQIYVSDKNGGLSIVTPRSPEPELHYVLPEGAPAASSGPIVAPDGTVYYTAGSEVQAISADGEPLWRRVMRTRPTGRVPHLSPDGAWLFLWEKIVRASDGEDPDIQVVNGGEQYAVGNDGFLYLRWRGNFFDALVKWEFLEERRMQIVTEIGWRDARRLVSKPTDMGATASRKIWLAYSFENFEDAKIAWTNAEGESGGITIFPHRPTTFIGVDRLDRMYACGQGGAIECLAIAPGGDPPLWTLPLPHGETVAGGAIVEGTLYVATGEGTLYALGAE